MLSALVSIEVICIFYTKISKFAVHVFQILINNLCFSVDGSITLFDAFVCYNADSTGKDIVFVKDMIKKLEKEYDLKLCVPGRDDLPGGSRYVTDAKLIESRYFISGIFIDYSWPSQLASVG